MWRKSTPTRKILIRLGIWEGERKVTGSTTTEMPNARSIRQKAGLHRPDVGIAVDHNGGNLPMIGATVAPCQREQLCSDATSTRYEVSPVIVVERRQTMFPTRVAECRSPHRAGYSEALRVPGVRSHWDRPSDDRRVPSATRSRARDSSTGHPASGLRDSSVHRRSNRSVRTRHDRQGQGQGWPPRR